MKAVKLVLLIWAMTSLILWIRAGQTFCVADTLPFAQRTEQFSRNYELLALAALVYGIWGLTVLLRREPTNRQQQTSTTGQQQAPANGPQLRAGIVLLPLTFFGLAALSDRYRSALRFDELIGDPTRVSEYRHLAILCVVVLATVLAVKLFGGRS